MTSTVATRPIQLADLHSSLSDPLLDTMNFLNEIANRFPDAISFAPGRPCDEPFNAAIAANYLQAYEQHLQLERGLTAAQAGALLFQYGRTKGHIHDLVATTIGNDEGVEVSPEAVVVTVGAQEAMLLVLRALMRDPDDVLLVASPCYLGITGAARVLDVPIDPVPEGPAGVAAATLRERVGRLRAAGRRPRLLYVIPDFANPSGIRMPQPAREELLRAATELDLLVLEDNPYGFFSRDDTRLPVLKSMTTVNTSPLAQAVIGGMLLAHNCRLRHSNQERIGNYRTRLNRLGAALAQLATG